MKPLLALSFWLLAKTQEPSFMVGLIFLGLALAFFLLATALRFLWRRGWRLYIVHFDHLPSEAEIRKAAGG